MREMWVMYSCTYTRSRCKSVLIYDEKYITMSPYLVAGVASGILLWLWFLLWLQAEQVQLVAVYLLVMVGGQS